MVLAEVRGDVVIGVDGREDDPSAVGRCGTIRRRHVRADRRDAEGVTAADAVATYHGEPEGTERRDDRELLRTCGERHDERSGFGAWEDRELCLGLGGLGFVVGDGLVVEIGELLRDHVGRGVCRITDERNGPREGRGDDNDIEGDECNDQAATEWRARRRH